MMRSLFSGVSGLRNHQTRMDVIGNNISNVNTVGYKSSRVVFQDIFSQNIAAGMANQGAGVQGGTNPIQIGLGINLATIDVIHTRSAFQRTDRPTDMMINGDGFFVVRGPDGDFFTRAGNFSIDDEGFLVNAQGLFVMGYNVPTVMGIVEQGRPATAGFPDTRHIADWELAATGDMPGTTPITIRNPAYGQPGHVGPPAMIPNPPDGEPGHVAGTAVGADITNPVPGTAGHVPAPATIPNPPYGDAGHVRGVPVVSVIPPSVGPLAATLGPPPLPAVDAQDVTLPVGFFNVGDIIPANSLRIPGTTTTWPATTRTVLAADGMVPSIPMDVALDIPMSRRVAIGSIISPQTAVPPRFGLVPTNDGPDLATLTTIRMIRENYPVIPQPLGPEFTDQIEWTINEDTGEYEINWTGPGGMGMTMEEFFLQFPMGDMSLPNFGVADNGDISILSGGRNVVIAQVAVAMFANPEGLEVAGGNLYRQTASSGEANIGQAGLDGAGAINGGGLEMSNVDMADQFTDMIVTQRGFQANSRIISVTDEILQEIVNLRR